VSDYIIPAAFLLIGLSIGLRTASLRARKSLTPPMLRVLGTFALATGGFLLALLLMCRPWTHA
jgi:predicted ABC-type sugar transport system permease subunit